MRWISLDSLAVNEVKTNKVLFRGIGVAYRLARFSVYFNSRLYVLRFEYNVFRLCVMARAGTELSLLPDKLMFGKEVVETSLNVAVLEEQSLWILTHTILD